MTYSVGYYIGVALAVIAVIAGALAAYGAVSWHPSWLTAEIAATAGIVAAICAGLSRMPEFARTPGKRETELVAAAAAGTLPKDVATKHPTIAAKPLDTLPPQ